MGSDLRCTTDFMLLSVIPHRQSHISCRVKEGCGELKSCLHVDRLWHRPALHPHPRPHFSFP